MWKIASRGVVILHLMRNFSKSMVTADSQATFGNGMMEKKTDILLEHGKMKDGIM